MTTAKAPEDAQAARLPYGFWPSDWSAEVAAVASRDFAELRAGQGGLFWIEYDPAEGRCSLCSGRPATRAA